MISTMRITSIAAAFALLCTNASAYVVLTARRTTKNNVAQSTRRTSLHMAGFGGGVDKKKSSSSAAKKLKPKSQWDKYEKMKKELSFSVAMRVVSTDETGEWYDIGKIKSEGDAFTELAIVLQRTIIAEHARRLHPLKFLPKDQVEWAYSSTASDDWIVVGDKIRVADAPKGMDKKIGFMGNPDPTGFYSFSVNKFGGNSNGGGTSSKIETAGDRTKHDTSVLPRVK